MSRIVVVRHGDTFAVGEEIRRIGAGTDVPLVASGIVQALSLGRHLTASSFHFARVLASPLLRTRQTVDAIRASMRDLPAVEPAAWLTEIDHGPDEGEAESAVLARLGRDALDAWDACATPPPGWVVDAERRIAAWRDLMRTADGGDTLVVTSNGVARFAPLSLSPASRPRHLKMRTGAFGIMAGPATGDAGLTDWHIVAWDVRPAPQP